MWCLETLIKINKQQQCRNAYQVYDAVGIRTLGNTPREEDKAPVKTKTEPKKE